jgi:hypothetical protein
MTLRILAVFLVVTALQVHTASAAISIWVGSLGELVVIESHLTPVEIEKRKTLVRRLERLLLNGMQTKAELEERFGPPSKWGPDGLVRPVGAEIFVRPENVKHSDVQGLLERSVLFPIADVGWLLVFLASDEKCYIPPVLFFKASESMPQLTDGNSCEKRIDWESPFFDALFQAAGTSATELTPTDGEAERAIESTKQIHEYFDRVRRSIDRTGDLGLPVGDGRSTAR